MVRRLGMTTLIVLVLLLLIGVPAVLAEPAQAGRVHIVRRGETLSWIAYRYGVSVWAIARANNLANPNRIYAGQRLWIPGGWGPPPPPPRPPHPGPRVHIVRWGETLSGIAWRYGVSAWAIARANGLYNINLIYAGQRLVIPRW